MLIVATALVPIAAALSTVARPDTLMLATYDRLAERLIAQQGQQELPERRQPLWVCIAGGPGSGKSTLAAAVAERINELSAVQRCAVLPMDGFHYSRAELCRLDPPDAPSFLPRRGAPWTFDAEACFTCLSAAKAAGEGTLPTYSRVISDPVPDGVRLLQTHDIVLVEGNYLLMKDLDPRWAPLDNLFDERWFIRCTDAEEQRQRLISRHLETWNEEKTARWGPGEEGAAARADANDVKNMVLIAPSEAFADLVIESI